MKRKYVILLHCTIWAVWLLMLNSWTIVLWAKQPPIPLAYNNFSLVIVFYTTRWMAGFYWRNVENCTSMWVDENGDIETRYPSNYRFYIWQKPLLGIICIVLAYIGISWLMDGLFVKLGLLPARYPDFYYYTFGKWTSIDFYVCVGNIMAAIEYHLRKEKGRRFILEENSRRVSEENKLLNEDVRTYLQKLDRRSKERGRDEDV